MRFRRQHGRKEVIGRLWEVRTRVFREGQQARRGSLDMFRRNQSRTGHLLKGEKMDGRLSLALVRVEHGAGPTVVLAIPVSQCVKALRNRPKLVWCWYSQGPSEKPV